ncbi:TIGR03792 family protein [Synechococcus sp. CB0205]|uniref:TIGR03792 family protein n=1 Tax=Synechococcus sp. CB0205 TaxID=232363 RepID=UPI0002002088|nr:TIGR03792 family protein [Synechococcus sp. CB0205]
MRLLARVAALVLCVAMLLAGHPDVAIATNAKPGGQLEVVVVEHLRIKVPADGRAAWLQAEQGSWEPWLEQQDGYLGRDLLWDSEREEGTLLIRWASREQWKAIPETEVEAVQERFEQLARESTGQGQGNPFPLVFEGELIPAA